MDLLTSILDNAEETAKEKPQEKPQIIPEKIGDGFSEIISTETAPLNDGETAEIFNPDSDDFLSESDDENAAESFNENLDFDVLTDIEKKRNLLYANMYVILVDTGAGLILQLTAGNWNEDADKKYTLSKPKRTELAEAWAEILNLEGHKKDPKSTLWMMFGGFYLPLIIMAVKERITLQREKKKVKAEKAKAAQEKEAAKVVKLPATKKHLEENKEDDILKVIELIETTETPEQERKRIADQVAHANAITEAEYATASLNDTTPVKNIVEVEKGVKNDPKTTTKKTPKKEPEEKETRGRQKGAKKNPKTGKFEMPARADGTHYFYKWGAKVKIPKSHKK